MGDLTQLEANGGYRERLRGIRLFFPEELEAALAAASAELSNVHAELKAVESTLREKRTYRNSYWRTSRPSQPVTDCGRRKRRKPESLPGAARKRVYHFRICRPVFQGTGIPSCQRPKHYRPRLSSLPKRKRPLQRVPGEESERPGIADREKQS